MRIPFLVSALLAACLLLPGALRAAAAPSDPAGASASLPVLAAAEQELHGTWGGQPFWARLRSADARFGGKRALEVVYTPPAPETIERVVLSDCPFVLVDDQLRVIAWNGRDTASQVVPSAKPPGYKVTRDVLVGEGGEQRNDPQVRVLAGSPAWDLHLAPLLLALAWHAGGAGQTRLVDLFGARAADQLALSWSGAQVTLAGAACTAEPAADGSLKRLLDAQGKAVLEVTGRP
jgi:hypothetical protein